MDLRTLCNLFGGSIWPEENRSRPEKIESHLAGLQEACRVANDEEARTQLQAEQHFVRGVHGMIRGDFTLAHRSFRAVIESDASSRWILRARLYNEYASIWQLWPPSLRFCSDFDNQYPASAFLQTEAARLNNKITEIAGKIRQDAAAKLRDIPEQMGFDAMSASQKGLLTSIRMDILECDLLNIHRLISMYQQNLLGSILPVMMGLTLDTDLEWFRKAKGDLMARISQQKEIAHVLGLPLAVNQLDHMLIELQRIEQMESYGWLTSDICYLGKLNSQYARLRDLVGVANTLVTMGDLQASPPFSSPLSLNLSTSVGRQVTLDNRNWDKIEAGMRLNDSDAARDCYLRAASVYQGTRCFIGQGLAILRLGCIAHMRAVYGSFESSVEREDVFSESRTAIVEAARLCLPIDQYRYLCLAHEILLSISCGVKNELTQKASSIGEWASDSGNVTWGQFLGFLLARFGRRIWLDHGRSDIALMCYSCAEACLSQIPMLKLSVLQVMGSRLDLQLSLSNHRLARALADGCLGQFRVVLKSTREEQAEYKGLYKFLSSVALLLVSNMRPLLARAYFGTGDEKALVNWIQELSCLEREFDQGQEAAARASLPHLVQRYEHGNPRNTRTIELIDQISLFYLADIQYDRMIGEYNIEAAERALTDFLDQTAAKPFGGQAQILMYVYHRLGRYRHVKELLDTMTDDELFNGETDHESMIQKPWSSKASKNKLLISGQGDICIKFCVLAQDWQRGRHFLLKILELDIGFLDASGIEGDHNDMWHRSVNAGLIMEFSEEIDQAFGYYLQALKSFELRNRSIADEDARFNMLYVENSGRVFNSLARVALRFHNQGRAVPGELNLIDDVRLQCQSWDLYALSFLEMAKARQLLESRLLTEAPLSSEPSRSNVSSAYSRRLLADLRGIPEDKRTRQEQEEIASLEKGLQDENIKDSIEEFGQRANPALNSDFKSFDFIPDEAAVVDFGVSREGFLLFCITKEGLRHASHQSVESLELQRVAYQYLHLISSSHLDVEAENEATKPTAQVQLLEELARILSNHMLGPIKDIIREKNHLIFIPSHPILGFPYSALELDGKPLFCAKAVSQAPSLATLRSIRSTAKVIAPRVSVVAKPGHWKDRAASESPLYMAGFEALTIGRTFQSPPYDGATTTRADLHKLMEGSDVLHIGTHGTRHPFSPWQSSISLAESFRVIDFLSASGSGSGTQDSPAALVVFSACLAAVGKSTVGSDVTGFSHAVLARGTRAFLGALWRVVDVSTMLLMRAFYAQLHAADGSAPLAELWRRAQCALYHTAPAELAGLREALMREWDDMNTDGAAPRPGKFVPRGKRFLEIAPDLMDLDTALDPKHPFHWAPFVIIGDGGLTFVNMNAERSKEGV